MPRKIEADEYWPEEKEMKSFSDFLIGDREDQTFHIGQGYEKEAATLLLCKDCGGTGF